MAEAQTWREPSGALMRTSDEPLRMAVSRGGTHYWIPRTPSGVAAAVLVTTGSTWRRGADHRPEMPSPTVSSPGGHPDARRLIAAIAVAALWLCSWAMRVAILVVACAGALASVDAVRTARRVDAGLAALRDAAERASAGDLTVALGRSRTTPT